MSGLFFLFYPWGLILQVIAIVHFVRRRPETFWLWIIIIGGGLGAVVYIAAEVIPDLGLLRGSFDIFSRRQRIQRLEDLVQQNPAAGNYEELADAYLEDRKYARARECYDRAISSRTDSPDPFYRRAICEIHLGDFQKALTDLEHVTAADPKYDLYRAQGLLAHAYANTGQPDKAESTFKAALERSTMSETMYNYADFLLKQGRPAEAKVWAQNILGKKAAMPGYLKRRERPWFRKAKSILKQVDNK
jgi:hypothetical protein